jgi:hypothetical protein
MIAARFDEGVRRPFSISQRLWDEIPIIFARAVWDNPFSSLKFLIASPKTSSLRFFSGFMMIELQYAVNPLEEDQRAQTWDYK